MQGLAIFRGTDGTGGLRHLCHHREKFESYLQVTALNTSWIRYALDLSPDDAMLRKEGILT